MKVLIILNGIIKDYRCISKLVVNFSPEYVLCADGAVKHARALSILPNKIMGDLDSANEEDLNYYMEKGVEIKVYPKEKDQTDGEIVVRKALELSPDEVMLIGATGGRIDQTIANIHILDIFSAQKINAYITDEKNKISIINQNTKIMGKKGDIVSIFPFGGSVEGITLIGFKYPLLNATINYGVPIGISNEIEEAESEIRFNKGKLLVIYNL